MVTIIAKTFAVARATLPVVDSLTEQLADAEGIYLDIFSSLR